MVSASEVNASLFVTCVIDQLFPEVGAATLRVLRRQGVKVDFPGDQTCCGQPLFNSGFVGRTRTLAKRVLKSFSNAQYVVVPSGSCATMIRVFYPELFHGDPEYEKQAQSMAEKTYEFSQFLVSVLGVTDVGATFDKKIVYHPSCHLLRELGVSVEPKALIGAVRGAQLLELERAESCCGFGGTDTLPDR